MIRVGITGQAGFIGTHLYNTLGLFPDKFHRIYFEDSFFSDPLKLTEFVSKCDTIIHLAALNRHNDPDELYTTNIELINKLLFSCDSAVVKPYFIFSSSTQEEKNNLYGLSKKEGRKLFECWATKNHSSFTGLIIPNVFGPFGNPYYNSVVATFCHQLTHNEIPNIEIDGELNLIYVGDLIDDIIKKIDLKSTTTFSDNIIETITIPQSNVIKVSELLNKLSGFKDCYLNSGSLPDISDSFDLKLYNTFLTYVDHDSFFPFPLKLNTDDRGTFVETVKLRSGGQISFSTTKPGIIRGNHFHTRKAERFAVIKGNARIEIRRVGSKKKLSFDLNGKEPSFVDMPVWFTHNITNIGNEDLYTIFWINELFNETDPDTYFELV